VIFSSVLWDLRRVNSSPLIDQLRIVTSQSSTSSIFICILIGWHDETLHAS
jgi:hypothetical protein